MEKNENTKFTIDSLGLLPPTYIPIQAVVFLDIDGVLADPTQRVPALAQDDYDTFYGVRMAEDDVHKDCLATSAFLYGLMGMYGTPKNVTVIILTGRPERTRTLSRLWIENKIPFFRNHIYDMLCRADDDRRVGFKTKWELMDNWLDGQEKVLGLADYYFLDDDYRNIRYCADRMMEKYQTHLHGLTIGAGRLPSPRAVNSAELGNGIPGQFKKPTIKNSEPNNTSAE